MAHQGISRRQLIQSAAAGMLLSQGIPALADGHASNPLLKLSAPQAVAAIQSGKVSATTYLKALLGQTQKHAGLNALVYLNEAQAMKAAAKIDADRKAGKALKPLAGLFIVAKDNINTKDMPTTGGTAALQGVIPKNTAPSIQRLTDAGAIVLAKANLHELAFGITSTNLSGAGIVRNPYDPSRIPGGSSGGTAVAVAVGMVPCGLGTDTGGSTRVPAALSGIVGFRPSVGNGGRQRRYHDENAVVPISRTRDTVGPMGKTVADVAFLDSAITGGPTVSAASLKGVRMGVPATFWSGLSSDLQAVVLEAKDKLAAAGVVMVDVDPDVFDLNNQVSFMVALHEPLEDFPPYLKASGIDMGLKDIVEKVASPDVKGAMGAVMGDVFGKAYPDAMKVHRPALQKKFVDYFKDNKLDAMLYPTTPLAASAIDEVNGSSKVSINGGEPADTFGTYIRNSDPSSNAGIPSLSIPAGLTASGLPVGIEIDGPLGSDRRLLALGLAMEKVLGRLPDPSGF
jgi:mandelamide amidase